MSDIVSSPFRSSLLQLPALDWQLGFREARSDMRGYETLFSPRFSCSQRELAARCLKTVCATLSKSTQHDGFRTDQLAVKSLEKISLTGWQAVSGIRREDCLFGESPATAL